MRVRVITSKLDPAIRPVAPVAEPQELRAYLTRKSRYYGHFGGTSPFGCTKSNRSMCRSGCNSLASLHPFLFGPRSYM